MVNVGATTGFGTTLATVRTENCMTVEIGKRLRDAIAADIRKISWLTSSYQVNTLAPTDRRIVVSRLDAPNAEVEIRSKEQWLRLKRDQRAAGTRPATEVAG
jgi:hypothetical protein